MRDASVSVSVAFNDNHVRQQFEAHTIDTEARIEALKKWSLQMTTPFPVKGYQRNRNLKLSEANMDNVGLLGTKFTSEQWGSILEPAPAIRP